MDSKIVIGSTTVVREVSAGSGLSQTDERDVESFLNELGQRTPLDTGVLPPGILCIRQAGDHMQIVHQSLPGINKINWGAYEGDRDYKVYELAQPYRIVVGDFVKGNLLGCRMFYSPTPVTTLDQPLYHQNVPNINCKGYRGNGVGWVCLYHRESWANMSIGEKARRMVERCSGVEAYNDANMSSTDGARFYKAKGKPDYTYSPTVWEKKSDKQGYNWTLDESLWLPVLVESQDSQSCHKEGGVPLTLRMAMEGNAAAYYGDTYQPKPINSIKRSDLRMDTASVMSKVFTEAFVAAKPTGTPSKSTTKPLPPQQTSAVTSLGTSHVTMIKPTQPVLKKANPACAVCAKPSNPLYNSEDYGKICNKCYTDLHFMCTKCLKVVSKINSHNKEYTQCTACFGPPPVFNCEACGSPIALSDDHSFTTPDKVEHHFCSSHFEDMAICCHCQKLHQREDTMTTKNWEDICLTCAETCQCQMCHGVFNWSGTGKKVCTDCAPKLASAKKG